MTSPRVAILVNPCPLVGPVASHWARARRELSERVTIVAEQETGADGAHLPRLTALLRAARPDVVIAGGGDGTVRDAAQAMMEAETAAALAIFPLGTANNVARSLGLLSVRQQGELAVERALAAVQSGPQRRIDLGRLDERYFVGSFAIGMDADILATRNRLQRRLRLGRRLGGYPLYLWSCAVNALLRRHGGLALVNVAGDRVRRRVYNLLLTNTPIYAGEFRFDAGNTCDDGLLDLHVFASALDYLRRYPAAWRRHVHYTRGDTVRPPRTVARVAEVRVEFPRPIPAQLDGEEIAPAAAFHLRAVPRALTVCVPPPVESA